MTTIGGRLKAVRLELGLSQRDMAADCGVSLRSYQLYEWGNRGFTVAVVGRLYRRYNISATWLLEGVAPIFAGTDQRPLSERIQ